MPLATSRLYWRMALYIGAALVAFIAFGIASLALVASRELASYVETRHSPLGREAAAVLARGGRQALIEWLSTEAQIPPDVTVYVLDRNSSDILGRPLPEFYAGFVRRSVVAPAESESSNFRPVRLAPQLIGPDGQAYAFLVLPNRITLRGSPATALGLLTVAILVIATVAWLIARTLARPIGELQRVVRELASGDIDARVPQALASRLDELGVLAADINTMAVQIKRLLESRQQLMGEMSHELRSPLARLQAALELAQQRRSIGSADSARIEQELRRMNRVIGDLLQLSRLASHAALSLRIVRIEALLAELVRDEELEAAARPCQLQLAAEPELVAAGDPDLLRSGFENILRNAIRYTAADSVVQIQARRDGRTIVIEFEDRGPGVPADYLQQIFEPYFRVPRSGPDTAGSGLGLAIARRVFEAHRGSIAAAQRAGGGLAITVRLPVADLT